MGRSRSPSSPPPSLAQLLKHGKIKEGAIITAMLPSNYNGRQRDKYVATGTITADAKIAYGGQTFATLEDFHQYLKVKRAAELREQNMAAPQTPGRPSYSAAAKSTTVEGVLLDHYSLSQLQIKVETGGPEKPIALSLDDAILSISDNEGDDDEHLPDASIDPYNDYDSLPADSLSEHSIPDENSSSAPSVEKIRSYPPQEIISSSLNRSSEVESPLSASTQESALSPPKADSLESNSSLDEPETFEPPKGAPVPHTMEMLSFGPNSVLSHSGSSWERTTLNQVQQPSSPPSDLSKMPPAKEKLLITEVKRKLREAQQKKKDAGPTSATPSKKRQRSPVSPCFFPPKKFLKNNQSSAISVSENSKAKRKLFEDDEDVISISDHSLPSPECSDSLGSSEVKITGSVESKKRSPSAPQKENSDSQRISNFPPMKKKVKFSQPVVQKSEKKSAPSVTTIPEQKSNPVELRTSLRSPSPEPPPPSTPTTPQKEISDNLTSKDTTPSPRLIASKVPERHMKSASPVIITSGLNPDMKDRVKMLSKKIGGELVSTFSDRVTHLVIFCNDGVPLTTIKFHEAILTGCWIVNYNWVLESFQEQKWVSENQFIARGFPGIIAGRKAHLKNEKRLFDSYTFCLYGNFTSPSKNDLSNIILRGHGTLGSLPPIPKTQEEELKRKKLFIICPNEMPDEAAQEVYFHCGSHPLAAHFVLDCTEQYTILNTRSYRFLDDDEPNETVPMSLAF